MPDAAGIGVLHVCETSSSGPSDKQTFAVGNCRRQVANKLVVPNRRSVCDYKMMVTSFVNITSNGISVSISGATGKSVATAKRTMISRVIGTVRIDETTL
jgi:hypothetical protein